MFKFPLYNWPISIILLLIIFMLIGAIYYHNVWNHLKAEIVIQAPVSQVWDTVGINFDKISHYSSDVAKSYYYTEVPGFIGNQRRSVMTNGRTLDVEITGWEQGKSVTWNIVKPHIPILKAGDSTYTLVPQGNNTTLLKFQGKYQTIFFLFNPIAQKKFIGVVGADLSHIKHLVETGGKASPETAKAIKQKYKNDIKIGE